MKYLVTGGNGFVGVNLIKALRDSGHSIVSIDDLSTGFVENEIDGVRYIYGNVNNISELVSETVDGVFHLAGLSRIQPSFLNPTETYYVNTSGTQSVCEWARVNKIQKVVYAGSSSKWHNPYQSPYALFKYLGEEICKMYRKTYDMNIEIARFYNVYGPYEILDGDWAAVIGIWRRQIRDGFPITIVGDGEQRRDFTHVVDIVDGLIKIMETNYKHEDAWELGTGKNHSILEAFEMFKQRFGCQKVHIPDQKGNYRETLRETDDALTLLNWNPVDRLEFYIHNL
jgi:UDP-glucose 4-epimerase